MRNFATRTLARRGLAHCRRTISIKDSRDSPPPSEPSPSPSHEGPSLASLASSAARSVQTVSVPKLRWSL